MEYIDPNWHTTEEQNVPIRVSSNSTSSEQLGKTISRKPAAIVGILVVLGMVTTFYYGVDSLTGQISENTEVIHITNSGLDPETITVQHGKSVEWINDQSIPHILESLTLCNTNGECLYTPTLFENDHVVFEITTDIPAGEYTYSSATSPDITGTIIVVSMHAAPSNPVTTSLSQTAVSEPSTDVVVAEQPVQTIEQIAPEETTPIDPVEQSVIVESDDVVLNPISNSHDDEPNDTAESAAIDTLFAHAPPPAIQEVEQEPPRDSTSANTENFVVASLIPTNPNTIGSQINRPPSTSANPSPSAIHSGAPQPPITGHKPFNNPETGAESTLIILALSIMSILIVARKSAIIIV